MPVSAPRGSMTGAAPGRRIRRLSESRTERSQRFPIAGVVSGLCMHLPLWKLAVFLGGGGKSATFVCIQTPHATEHALPFALAAPAAALYTKWQVK